MSMMKMCRYCQVEKELDLFDVDKRCIDGHTNRCKRCRNTHYQETKEEKKEVRQKYITENRNRILETKRRGYQRNKAILLQRAREVRQQDIEVFRAKRKQERQENLEERRKYDREYSKKRRENNLQYRLVGNLRNRIRLSIENKSECTKDLLGCSLDYFIKHLESQFASEMTWDNYGSYWSIDHIEPCCSFDLSIEENQRKCFNWQNCRPLTITENSSKGNTIDKEKRIKKDKMSEFRVSNKQDSITI